MASFGDFKNNVAKLRKYLTKMNIFEELNISKNQIEEQDLRRKSIDFFLQLIHHVFTSYSGDFYSAVLDVIPNIKTLSDKRFMESVINISRRILKMDPEITAEQILSSKYTEKKVEFIADLCMNIFEWQANNKKKAQATKKIKEVKTNELKNYMYEPPAINVVKQTYPANNFDDFDEDELLEQREITVEPTQYNFEQVGQTFGKGSSALLQKRINEQPPSKDKNVAQSFNSRPNVFPKSMRNEYLEDDLDNEEQNNKYKANQVAPKKEVNKGVKVVQTSGYFASKPMNSKQTNQEQDTQEADTVTRQQFNEALMMISNMNKTLNDMVSKFNNFQGNVVSWMNNIEARFSIIQENVKTIKANL